jgi:regulator of replication initiation timing
MKYSYQEHRPNAERRHFHELNNTKRRSQRLIDDAVQIRLETQDLRARLAEQVHRLTEERTRRARD